MCGQTNANRGDPKNPNEPIKLRPMRQRNLYYVDLIRCLGTNAQMTSISPIIAINLLQLLLATRPSSYARTAANHLQRLQAVDARA